MPQPQNTTITFSKDQWFCIGTSGKTVDGRDIKPEWLEQCAEDYDPKLYGARINVEHLRSAWPGSEFAGYGDVTALKTESANGITKLFAQIDPTDKLVALNQKREKIYTSMELHTNFQEKQRAYLVGLAITDSPSSVGTSALQFNTDANSPYSIKPEFYISEPTAMTQNTQAQQDNAATVEKEDQAPSWFTKFFSKPAPAAEAKAEAADLQKYRTETEAGFAAAGQAIQDLEAKQNQQFSELMNEVKSLRQELSQQPAPQEETKLHTGADASVKYTAPNY